MGIYVGNKVGANRTKALSNLNFAEQLEKIKNKINYWRGKGISLLGRVKVINIFVLSRLWHRTQIVSINADLLNIFEKIIRDFIWQNKQGGRIRQDVLQLSYEEGGLQLADIKTKTKTQRIQRVAYLLRLKKDNFERFIADKLIGNSTKFIQYGLSYGLTSNKERIKMIKNTFYKEALMYFNELNIKLIPGNRFLIQNEPVFFNKFFQDANGRTFIPTENNYNIKTIHDLERCTSSVSIIESMKLTLNNMEYSNLNENVIILQTRIGDLNLNSIPFKEIYINGIITKNTRKEWENKWANYLENREINWKMIWSKIYSNMNNHHVISAQWEILHLNFWSSYKANENWKLCRETSDNDMHIITQCNVLKDVIRNLKIHAFFPNEETLAFGCTNQLVNFVFFSHQKSCFQDAFQKFP